MTEPKTPGSILADLLKEQDPRKQETLRQELEQESSKVLGTDVKVTKEE